MSGALIGLSGLDGQLQGPVHRPGSAGYARATSPRNATARQEPLAVASAAVAGDVAVCLRWAEANGVEVAVQATGHGAGRDIGPDQLLIDTSGLDAVEVDPDRRVVRAGAGATFAAINAAAWEHHLLAPAGTAPDVAVVGYTAWGGVGWLTRPHGLASASLLAVDLVDGSGRTQRADDTSHQEVLWAYRGGGGVGVATSVEMQLFPAGDLWAGYLLWPADHAQEVLSAWGRALPQLHPSLSSHASLLLHAPDAPTVPEDLRGRAVVHMAAASVAGQEGMSALRRVLAELPPAALDTLGPCDARRLSTIHLDPPAAVPALGRGRWLRAAAGEQAAQILTAAGTEPTGALAEVELRHVAHAPTGVSGAMTDCPGELLLHATGAAADAASVQAVDEALEVVLVAASADDIGRSAAAFHDGRAWAPDALDSTAQHRLSAVRESVDHHHRVAESRRLT